MPTEIESENIVVIASKFNPSIVTERWLERHEVLLPEDEVARAVCLPVFAQIQAASFSLVVTDDKLIFTWPDQHGGLPRAIDQVTRIVQALPETPYSGAGVNFLWATRNIAGGISDYSRRMFGPNDGPLAQHFASPDAKFGSYMSVGLGNCRLRLDIKPVTEVRDGEASEAINLSFNYHFNAPSDNPRDAIVDFLERAHIFREHSEMVIASLPD